ncbi:MAG: bifunctional folylpolyglutamate synthase/dihydrofolate synthase [Myxococcota bacterium]
MRFHNLSQGLNHLYNLRKAGIKYDLVQMSLGLEELGNPHLSYPSIQIAGTNGKGTTAFLVESILRHHGYKTGLFTSPHLTNYRERIKVDGKNIKDSQILTLLNHLANLDTHLSFFETTTALAHQFFYNQNIDLAIFEAGLGGRLDSTNLCNPILAIITSVSSDHQAFLTASINRICWEKTGIVKPGVPVIIPRTIPIIQKWLLEYSTARGGIPLIAGKDFSLSRLDQKYSFEYKKDPQLLLDQLPFSDGKKFHLVESALAASRIILQKPLDAQIVKTAFSGYNWPGRFEQIGNFILDGAHNPQAAKELAFNIKTRCSLPVNIISGMMKDKDYQNFYLPLLALAKTFYLTNFNNSNAVPDNILKNYLDGWGAHTKLFNNDLQTLLNNLNSDTITIVCGSFYLAGEVRRLLLQQKEDILPLSDPRN